MALEGPETISTLRTVINALTDNVVVNTLTDNVIVNTLLDNPVTNTLLDNPVTNTFAGYVGTPLKEGAKALGSVALESAQEHPYVAAALTTAAVLGTTALVAHKKGYQIPMPSVPDRLKNWNMPSMPSFSFSAKKPTTTPVKEKEEEELSEEHSSDSEDTKQRKRTFKKDK